MLYTQVNNGAFYMVQGTYQPSFYQRLVNAIDRYIVEYGELDVDCGYSLMFDDLDEMEQGELIALMIESDERDAYSCFHQDNKYAKDDDIVCALLKMLNNNTSETREDLGTIIYQNSVMQYAPRLQELIDDRCGWVFQDWKDSKGFDE